MLGLMGFRPGRPNPMHTVEMLHSLVGSGWGRRTLDVGTELTGQEGATVGSGWSREDGLRRSSTSPANGGCVLHNGSAVWLWCGGNSQETPPREQKGTGQKVGAGCLCNSRF